MSQDNSMAVDNAAIMSCAQGDSLTYDLDVTTTDPNLTIDLNATGVHATAAIWRDSSAPALVATASAPPGVLTVKDSDTLTINFSGAQTATLGEGRWRLGVKVKLPTGRIETVQSTTLIVTDSGIPLT